MRQHELELAVQRVRELHLQTTLMCAGCLDPSCPIDYEACQECGNDYPCETIKALDGEWNPLDHPVPHPDDAE